VPAIRRLTAEGISVNVTLIFSLQRYAEVIDAYVSGLEDLVAIGGDPSAVFSVASFFVSRFDTEVDRRLEALDGAAARSLLGRTAVANARVAYGVYEEAFSAARFGPLQERGAVPQKPLWASTSTKNPAYDDLLYVEGLVAPGTVNTMPLETIDAYQDHGDPTPTPFTGVDIERARADLDALAGAGVEYDDVVATLEREGVEKFVGSWHQLLDSVERG
jgi:transaldolase